MLLRFLCIAGYIFAIFKPVSYFCTESKISDIWMSRFNEFYSWANLFQWMYRKICLVGLEMKILMLW